MEKKKVLIAIVILTIVMSLVGCGADSSSTDAVSENATKADNTSTTVNESTVEDSSAAEKSVDNDNSAEGGEATASVGENTQDWAKVGETVTIMDVEYTLNAYKKTKGSELMEADDGNIYCLIEMNVKNNGAEEAPLSSLLMFELSDSEGNIYDVSLGGLVALDDYKIQQLDGSIAAAEQMVGGLAYEVPEKAKGLVLTIKSPLDDEKATINLD